MVDTIKTYLRELSEVFDLIEVGDQGGTPISLDKALDTIISWLSQESLRAGRLLYIGNGGSAAIATHQAQDAMWRAGLPALP